MQDARCNLCGSETFRVLERETFKFRARHPELQKDISVVRCIECGLKYLVPQPDDIALKYEDKYFDSFLKSGCEMAGGSYEVAEYLKKRLMDIEEMTGGRGRLLEVGIGTGTFLGFAKEQGWDVCGVDVSKWASARAKEKYGVETIQGDILEITFTQKFDAVHMNHSLEHMPDPRGVLKKVNLILRDRGILFVEVPNEFNTLLDMVKENLLKRIPGEPSYHLYFFTPKTLAEMVKKAGFGIVRCRSVRREKDLKSRYFLGGAAKFVIYVAEEIFDMKPNIELVAFKKSQYE